MPGLIEERVKKLEHDLEETATAASSHFVELRAYIHDTLQSRFEEFGRRLDQRFGQIDQRFGQIDRRFEQIDRRFGQIDQRFEKMDQRFDRLESQLDLFIQTQGGINRVHERRLRALERRTRSAPRPKR